MKGPNYPEKTGMVLAAVYEERGRQDEKWGEQNHSPTKWALIEGEEYGEVCRAIYENDHEGYRRELIQVAAVAVAAVESYDRNEGKVID